MVRVPLSPQRCPVLLHSPSLALAAAAAVTALAAGCSRTGLDIDEDFAIPVVDSAVASNRPEAGPDADADADAAEDTFVGVEAAAPIDPCANMPPIPCPGGGYEYCVAGQYSACPQRCGVCIPGSQQVCFI